ncbi:MAG: SGNH/GDSL hydrolase family protein [Wenzhouxiangella sp.]|nr:MAG: SGNH/GDSL hydrolase family protein [Wenzhouxiangella sp.]
MTLDSLRIKADLALLLAPLALPQGLWLKRKAQRLPEAAGERGGLLPGTGPALRLLSIGESPLAGVGLDRQDQALTARLADGLAASSGRSVTWQSAARGGVTARRSLTELAPRLDAGPADLIIIGLGVNDSVQLRPAPRWQADLLHLINALRQRHGPAPVILAGVPDMQRFPLLPQPLALMLGLRSRLLDRAAAELATSMEAVHHAPLPLDGESRALFCEDGFHPNARGHGEWAERLQAFVSERDIF